MVVVAIIGILAAVAIPAFLKNARKAKTTEATIQVKKLQDGAVAYYHAEMNAAGTAIPIAHQFPATPVVATQPSATCCPPANPSGKCQPDHTLWADPSWQALTFSIDDPHYYQYRYVRNANGFSGAAAPALSSSVTATEWFYADAIGDLNCDGTFSTFEMLGGINSDGSVMLGGGLFKDKELE